MKSAPRAGGLGRKLRRRLLAASPRRRGGGVCPRGRPRGGGGGGGRLGDAFVARLRRGVGGLRRAARLALAGKRIDRRGGALGRGQWLRLHAPRRGLAGLPRIWLIRIRLLGVALVRIALVGIALVGILRIALLRTAARHARRWPWRRPKQGFERVEELRSGGQHAERRPCRDRRGDGAGDAQQ